MITLAYQPQGTSAGMKSRLRKLWFRTMMRLIARMTAGGSRR